VSAARTNAIFPKLGGIVGATSVRLRRSANWWQLTKFCLVGASGYVINLGVYTVLLTVFNAHYLLAAAISFLVAVSNNYLWNRQWTFRLQRGHPIFQGLRFLTVSTLALGANLALLTIYIQLGLPEVAAQAIAILTVTPSNFLANKLWSFRH